MPQGLSAGEWGLGHTCPAGQPRWTGFVAHGPQTAGAVGRQSGRGVSASYQWPRWTTSLNGRRSGLRIGTSGRSAG